MTAATSSGFARLADELAGPVGLFPIAVLLVALVAREIARVLSMDDSPTLPGPYLLSHALTWALFLLCGAILLVRLIGISS